MDYLRHALLLMLMEMLLMPLMMILMLLMLELLLVLLDQGVRSRFCCERTGRFRSAGVILCLVDRVRGSRGRHGRRERWRWGSRRGRHGGRSGPVAEISHAV